MIVKNNKDSEALLVLVSNQLLKPADFCFSPTPQTHFWYWLLKDPLEISCPSISVVNK